MGETDRFWANSKNATRTHTTAGTGYRFNNDRENNPTQEQIAGEQQAPTTINPPDAAWEMKTEKIPAQRLPIEPETTPPLNDETPWVDYDGPQNDWGANYYSLGMPMTMPMYWENAPETQSMGKQKGGKQLPAWSDIRRDPVGEVYAKLIGR